MPRRNLPVLALACLGVLISITSFVVIHSLERDRAKASFERAANQRFDEVQADLELAVNKLIAVGSFCESSYPFSRAEFENYVRPIFHLNDPGIQALEWEPRVTLKERSRFEREARANGLEGFEIRDHGANGMVPAAQRAVYYPVLYVHPYAGNEAALGFDLFGAEPNRHEAFLQAESTGELTATSRVTLVQETGTQAGVLLLRPVYDRQGGARRMIGAAMVVLRIGDLVEKRGTHSQVDLVVSDFSSKKALQQLYPAPGKSTPASSDWVQYRMISVAGRTWELSARPMPGVFPVPMTYSVIGAALSMFITILVAVYLFDLVGHRFQVERVVEERTAALNAAILSLAQVHRGLEESEARYRRLVEDSPLAIVVEREGRIVLANRAAVDMFSFDALRDTMPHTLLEYVVPERREIARRLFEELTRYDGQLGARETQVLRGDGVVLDVEAAASSFSSDGKRSIQVILRDITQRKRAEAENARLIRAIDQVDESVVVTDTDGAIVYVNPAFERVTGYTRDEVMGRNPRLLKSNRQPPELYTELWRALKSGESWSGRLINRAKDGHLYTEEATMSPVFNREGEIIHFVAVKRDVTREVNLTEQLRQSAKMDAVGRLAGGVAHDFNNMLMVIVSYAELIANGLPEGDPLLPFTEQVLRAAQRSSALTRQLLAFSRKQVLSLQVLDCNAIIMETTSMVRRLIAENIELKCNLAPNLWPVKADADQIVQVILNLCANSRDAMPHGGLLTISSRNVAEDGMVVLEVSDTGTGIAPELQERLFEPFFTTKAPSKGTGLGLATVYAIVQQSGGHIKVDSAPGQGASFSILLPRCEEASPTVEDSAGKSMTTGRGRVLVVEDESALRQAISDQLRARGYQVIAAGDGVEALEALRNDPSFNILISDLIMPRMGGRELAHHAVGLVPQMEIIFMSGYAEQSFTEEDFPGTRVEFIQKPFSMNVLLTRLAEMSKDSDTFQAPLF